MPVSINNTQIVFNDSTTQSTAAVVNTTAVLNATAGASVGAVGTYAFLGESGSVTTQAGGTRAGSALYYAGVSAAGSYSNRTGGNNAAIASATAASGTWRCMGVSIYWSNCFANFFPATLWLRIS